MWPEASLASHRRARSHAPVPQFLATDVPWHVTWRSTPPGIIYDLLYNILMIIWGIKGTQMELVWVTKLFIMLSTTTLMLIVFCIRGHLNNFNLELYKLGTVFPSKIIWIFWILFPNLELVFSNLFSKFVVLKLFWEAKWFRIKYCKYKVSYLYEVYNFGAGYYSIQDY